MISRLALAVRMTLPAAQPAYDNLGLYLGADLDSGSLLAYYHGAIDDLRIYNRALSTTELDQLAHPP